MEATRKKVFKKESWVLKKRLKYIHRITLITVRFVVDLLKTLVASNKAVLFLKKEDLGGFRSPVSRITARIYWGRKCDLLIVFRDIEIST